MQEDEEPTFLVIDEPHETDPEVLRKRLEAVRAYSGPGGGETPPGRYHPSDDESDMEPAEFVPGPPAESYQESCDRYFWETIGGTRPHPHEH